MAIKTSEDFEKLQAIRVEYFRQRDIAAVQFFAEMRDHDWQPIMDIYDGIYAWQSAKTNRIVQHTNAFDVWEVTQQTPAHIARYEVRP